MLLAPGSIPSVLRAQLGVSWRPMLLYHFDGVWTSTPQTMNPAPGVGQPGSGPAFGKEVSLTWNLAELCSLILYSKKPVVVLTVLTKVGWPMLPSISRSA